MKNWFAKVEDVEARLNSGYVQYKGQWCYVWAVEGWNIHLKRFSDSKEFVVSVKKEDPNLDFSRPRIGFFNLNESAYFCNCLPARQFKQVLSPQQISLWDISKNTNNINEFNGYPRKEILHGFTGEYPQFKDAFKTIQERNAIAFSRTLAIVKKINKQKNVYLLYHMTDSVGHYDEEKKVFILDETFNTPLIQTILNTHEVPYQ